MNIHLPTTPTEIRDIILAATETGETLEIFGQGSKKRIGRLVTADNKLDLSKLSGVNFYEPEELVISLKAGTPIAEVEALLATRGQQLAFEPLDYANVLAQVPGKGTIGGVLATNASGPRRLKAGAARDHILGIEAVSGRGELFKSGGRVMKNVTGYDLSKGMAGSWGTLAVLTDVIFKVLPAAETEQTLVLIGLDDAAATFAMAVAMGSNAEVSSAAHLPITVVGKVIDGALSAEPATLLRIEGFAKSVTYRIEKLRTLLGIKADILPQDLSRKLWREVRDCVPFADHTNRPLWRVSVAPMSGHAIVADIRLKAGVDAFYDWQGGLIWMRMESGPEAGPLRALIKKHGGGHATLIRAYEHHRQSTPVFQPQPPALAALSQRLKEQFDPLGLLNPRRMH
jgi:glycolate oxidase FAD binding subunit